MKKLTLALLITFISACAFTQVKKDTTQSFTREQLQIVIEKLAEKVKVDHPAASVVLYSLLSAMYLNKEKMLATKAIEICGKLIEEKTISN